MTADFLFVSQNVTSVENAPMCRVGWRRVEEERSRCGTCARLESSDLAVVLTRLVAANSLPDMKERPDNEWSRQVPACWGPWPHTERLMCPRHMSIQLSVTVILTSVFTSFAAFTMHDAFSLYSSSLAAASSRVDWTTPDKNLFTRIHYYILKIKISAYQLPRIGFFVGRLICVAH